MFPIYLVDYLWVITLYCSMAFWLAVLIDGYILPRFDPVATSKKWSITLFAEILGQLAVQGLLAVMFIAILQRLPTPVQGVFGYNAHSPTGALLRNPAIISALLLSMSKSLQGRLQILFSRFDRNAGAVAEATALKA